VATWDDLRRVALGLPETEERTSRTTPSGGSVPLLKQQVEGRTDRTPP